MHETLRHESPKYAGDKIEQTKGILIKNVYENTFTSR